MRCLLWNVGGKPLTELIVQLAQRHRVNVILLVERLPDDTPLLVRLREVGRFHKIPSHDRFGLYVRFPESYVQRRSPPVVSDRMDSWCIARPGYQDATLVAVHGLDIRNNPDAHRATFFERVAENVMWLERQAGHKRTIIAGEFNANPFDPAVIGARNLHAIRMPDINGRLQRTVLGREYEFFYNPMWRCYGGNQGAPVGTYYHYSYTEQEIFWHMLDQVVIRPQLREVFRENRLQILGSAGESSLVDSRGVPDRKKASDHLPLLFECQLKKSE